MMLLAQSIAVTSFFFLLINAKSIDIKRDIFNDPTEESFKIYWNVPSYQCRQHGIDFTKYTKEFGIITNDNDAFRGNEINILYDPGLFPAYMTEGKEEKMTKRNGGIPQLGNLSLHLDAFQKVVENSVSKDLTGVGIIDFEIWRPVFRQNWVAQVIYRNASADYEKEAHPEYTDKEAMTKAKNDFEKSAKAFMLKTLELAKDLRPKAKWGYYGYPYCYNHKPETDPSCPEMVLKENDELSWLWKSSSAFYLSLYISSKYENLDTVKFLAGRLNEAWRVTKGANPKKFSRVYPYIWFKYNNEDKYLSRKAMTATLQMIKMYKMGGVIIWGKSADVNTKEKCISLKNYILDVLGPAIQFTDDNGNSVNSPIERLFRYLGIPLTTLVSSRSVSGGYTIL